MSDKTDAWMPLWIGAYLADTQMLSTAQHGAYLLLLMAYWRERRALPNDDESLRSITKSDRAEWKRLRPVMARFFKIEDGAWWHKRVEAEIAAADKRKAGAVSKAIAAAGARWGHANANASSIPQALPEECPTPSPSLRSKPPSPRKRGNAKVDEELFQRFYAAYPRKVAPDAARRAFAKRSPTAEMVDAMVTAIASQGLADRCRIGEAQFVPHPATWLNEGRWKDGLGGDGGTETVEWHQTAGGIKVKGAALGIPYTSEDECKPFGAYRARVFMAAGYREAA